MVPLPTCVIRIKWTISWVYGTFRPPWTQSSNAHAQPSSGAKCLIFGRTLRLLPYLSVRTAKALARLRRCAGSPEPSLVAYVISIIISWADSNVTLRTPNSVDVVDYMHRSFSSNRHKVNHKNIALTAICSVDYWYNYIISCSMPLREHSPSISIQYDSGWRLWP